MRTDVLVLLAAIAAPIAEAQVVHPNQYELSEGAGHNLYPFAYGAGAGRYQQTYDKTQFPNPMLITEMAFRYKGDLSYVGGPCDLKLSLAYCANAWNAVSTTFDQNIGAELTTVFDGIWVIPAFSGDPAVPNPFTARLVLTTPFFYHPSGGDLLMDVRIRSSVSSSGGAFVRSDFTVGCNRIYANTGDPNATTGGADGIGLITEFTEGSISIYGSGCAGSGGITPTLTMAGIPGLGQQVLMLLENGLGGAPSLTFISAGEANQPIGGGCSLLVQFPAIAIPITLGGAGDGAGSYFLPGIIPPTAPLGSVYFQTFVLDPMTQTGFSTSNGLRVTIM